MPRRSALQGSIDKVLSVWLKTIHQTRTLFACFRSHQAAILEEISSHPVRLLLATLRRQRKFTGTHIKTTHGNKETGTAPQTNLLGRPTKILETWEKHSRARILYGGVLGGLLSGTSRLSRRLVSDSRGRFVIR